MQTNPIDSAKRVKYFYVLVYNPFDYLGYLVHFISSLGPKKYAVNKIIEKWSKKKNWQKQ